MDRRYAGGEKEGERQNGNSTLIILINANICFTRPFFDICGMRNIDIVWFVKTPYPHARTILSIVFTGFQEIGSANRFANYCVYVENRIDDGLTT